MAQRPNILFLLADQWRADWTQMNRNLPLRTPNVAALAGNGIQFTRAITPSPLCGPARAAMTSGMEYDRCGVRDNRDDYPHGQRTFYSLLQSAGYHVMGCGKFDLAKAARGWKVDGSSRLKEWGFDQGIDSEGKWDAIGSGSLAPQGPYMAYLESRGLRLDHVADMRRRARAKPFDTWPTSLPGDAYCDNWVAAQGLHLLQSAPKARPWFLQVNFPGPHDPWDVTVEMAKLYQEQDFPIPMSVGPADAPAHRAVRRHYAAMIQNIDRLIGLYINALQSSGQSAQTLIVVSSDHGEMLGEQGVWGKDIPNQGSLAVPLVVAGPGIPRGRLSHSPISLVDLAATFIEFAQASTALEWDSRSWRGHLQDPSSPPPRTCVRSGMPQWRVVFDGRHKLVVRSGGAELFDLEADPDERVNIAVSKPNIADHLLGMLLRVPDFEEAQS